MESMGGAAQRRGTDGSPARSGGAAPPDHPAVGTVQDLEAVPAVEVVGVGGRQHETLDLLQIGVGDCGIDQGLAQAGAAMLLEDEDVAQPGEGAPVGDQPGKADGHAAVVDAEGDAVGDGAHHRLPGSPPGPVGGIGEPSMHHVDVDQRRIVGDQVLPVALREGHGTTISRAPPVERSPRLSERITPAASARGTSEIGGGISDPSARPDSTFSVSPGRLPYEPVRVYSLFDHSTGGSVTTGSTPTPTTTARPPGRNDFRAASTVAARPTNSRATSTPPSVRSLTARPSETSGSMSTTSSAPREAARSSPFPSTSAALTAPAAQLRAICT